jgi:hypothetical protein
MYFSALVYKKVPKLLQWNAQTIHDFGGFPADSMAYPPKRKSRIV